MHLLFMPAHLQVEHMPSLHHSIISHDGGVSSFPSTVLLALLCPSLSETPSDDELLLIDFCGRLFERGASSVGLDFLAHPFWDKYLEFEERLEAWDRIFVILSRVIHIPMHQYARYFEKYRQLATSRPLAELCPAEDLAQFRAEIGMDTSVQRAELDVDRDLRQRIDNYHLEVFHKCQAETNKRWTFEQEVKRPYFHVTELDDAQLDNWRKYLAFEEGEGEYQRIVFLYERCLVAAAYYDEFWLRYARWMQGQMGKTEEVRHIYQRASCFYAPIARPACRLQWALFEAAQGRVDVSQAIYEAMLLTTPGHVETIMKWANSQRRHSGIDAAITVLQQQIDSPGSDNSTKAALLTQWAHLLWKVRGSTEQARQLFQQNQQAYLDSRVFWSGWLAFEIAQPTTAESEAAQLARVRAVFDDVRRRARLPLETVQELALVYMDYLEDRGTGDVEKECMTLDRDVNGYV